MLGLKLPFGDMSRQSFPLPVLGPLLRSLAWVVADGLGFFVLQGVDPDRYTAEENMVIYLGISAYISQQWGRQDEQGNMLRTFHQALHTGDGVC